MKEISRKLTLEQISKDVHSLNGKFDDHAREDAAFQAKSTDVHESIERTLAIILNKLDPHHEDYINRELEREVQEMKTKLDQVWGLFQGLSWSGRAIKYTAGIAGALSIIIVSIFAAIRFIVK